MLRVTSEVRSTHTQDGAVVLDIRQGQMFHLNLIGSNILKLLERGCPESEIVEELCRDFNISMETARADVREFLEALQSHRLLEDDAHGKADR